MVQLQSLLTEDCHLLLPLTAFQVAPSWVLLQADVADLQALTIAVGAQSAGPRVLKQFEPTKASSISILPTQASHADAS